MLKIKDNIDLKELEKFGFIYVHQKPESYSYYTKEVVGKTCEGISVIINVNTRYMWIEDTKCHNYFEGLDYIFDLIEANLVEKVEVKW